MPRERKECPQDCPHNGQLRPQAVFKMEKDIYRPYVCGIVSQRYLLGMAYDAAKEIGHPLLFLQQIPGGCVYQSNVLSARQKRCELCDKTPQNYIQGPCNQGGCGKLSNKADYACLEVVDADFVGFSPLCREIRKKRLPLINIDQDRPESNINDCWCCDQDNLIAGYLLGKEGSKEKVKIEKMNPIEEKIEPGNYWRFICRVTGYTKLAFKIDLGIKNLPLVMICGQFLVDDGRMDSKNNIAKNDKLSVEFGVSNAEHITIGELQEIASTIFDEIEILKNRILTIHKTRLRSINNRFVGNVIPEIAKSDWKYDDLKDEIHRLVKEYADLADIPKKSCFMTTHLDEHLGRDLTNKHGIAIRAEFIDEYQSHNLELVEISEIDTKWLCKIPNLNDYTHLIFPSDSHQFNIMVLLRIDNENVQDKKLMRANKEFFKIMLPVVRGVASGLFSKRKKDVIAQFTQDLRHELGQSNIGFLANLDDFEKNLSLTNTADARIKIINNIKNARGYAYATMIRANTSRYIHGVPEPNRRYFDPYGSFLHKWSSVYSNSMISLGLRFKLSQQERIKGNSPPMYADPYMIEQVAYNLTNNAMKYSLPGTTVSVNCHLNNAKDLYQLIVTSYGISLQEYEYSRIFEDGFQGSNARIELDNNPDHLDSVGRGLALSREIAVIHGGSLELYHKKMSNLCVPYFNLFLESHDSPLWKFVLEGYGLMDLHQVIQAETERLKRENIDYWNDMNAIIQRNLAAVNTPYTIIDTLTKSVTRYNFTLSIPYRERE